MYFFISKVKISLQMDKFPSNDLAKMPIFSHHGALSQKYQHFWKLIYASYSKLSKELKSGIKI